MKIEVVCSDSAMKKAIEKKIKSNGLSVTSSNESQIKETNAIIHTNYRNYSAQECYESGFRDGCDGIRFYPCTAWDLVEGDAVLGQRSLAENKYTEGYKAGREHWKQFTGSYPQTGSNHLDINV